MTTPNEGMAKNQQSWDQRVATHFESTLYQRDLQQLREGGDCLPREIVEDVGDVAGKTLLHLQCHFGLDTLSWARRGAIATGLDFSQPAIDLATQLAGELDIDAQFVCANVYDAPQVIHERFDVVFTSLGVLCWLPDVGRWADVAAKMLKPGGLFYLMDGHPITHIFDDEHETDLRVRYSYFDNQPLTFGRGPSYAGGEGSFSETVEWQHTLSDMVNALIDAGLRIQRMREWPGAGFRQFPFMQETSPNHFELPGDLRGKVPQQCSITARKQL